jgi:hypothetical protein
MLSRGNPDAAVNWHPSRVFNRLKGIHINRFIETTVSDTTRLNPHVSIGYQWSHNGCDNAVEEYGRLYNWYAITDSHNVCPAGWYVPTDVEWNTLFNYLGNDSIAIKYDI